MDFCVVVFSHWVVSDSLQPHGLQLTRLLCPPLCPRGRSNLCPLSLWCYLIILFSASCFSFGLQSFIRVFSNESAFHNRWPKYWSVSFGISPSSEYSGLISFRVDWFDLFDVLGTHNSLLEYHSSKASILQHSAFFMVWLSHLYMTLEKP